MTEPDGIENRGGDCRGKARLVAASLKNPEGPGVSFRGGGEGLEVQRLLSGGPDGVNPVDKVLAQGEKTLVQCRHSVSGLKHQVKLGDLRGGPVAKTDPMAIFRGKKKQKCWKQTTVEVRGEREQAETGIRVKPGFCQQGVLAGPKDVVVCVVR